MTLFFSLSAWSKTIVILTQKFGTNFSSANLVPIFIKFKLFSTQRVTGSLVDYILLDIYARKILSISNICSKNIKHIKEQKEIANNVML